MQTEEVDYITLFKDVCNYFEPAVSMLWEVAVELPYSVQIFEEVTWLPGVEGDLTTSVYIPAEAAAVLTLLRMAMQQKLL